MHEIDFAGILQMKKYNWILVSALYLFLGLMDGLLTFINTPDLQLEANPLVKYLNLGWGALFLANAAAFGLFVVLARAAFDYKYKPIQASGFFDFYMKLLFGEGYRPSWFWYRLPENWKPVWGWFGFAYIYISIVARAVLVTDWLLYTFQIDVNWWNRMGRGVPFGRLDLWAGLFAGICSMAWWMNKRYRASIRVSGKR